MEFLQKFHAVVLSLLQPLGNFLVLVAIFLQIPRLVFSKSIFCIVLSMSLFCFANVLMLIACLNSVFSWEVHLGYWGFWLFFVHVISIYVAILLEIVGIISLIRDIRVSGKERKGAANEKEPA